MASKQTGRVVMDGATVPPCDKSISPIAATYFNGKGGRRGICNEMATLPSQKDLGPVPSGEDMNYEITNRKGVVVSPIAAISPTPSFADGTTRPGKQPGPWE
jgi:hypothetical protein